MSKYVDRVLAELKEKNAHELRSGCRCTSGVREGSSS